MARTDARSVEGFDAAVDRARQYLDAGADWIFPEALESLDEFARFARTVPAPLLANLTEFGRSPLPSFDVLAGLGLPRRALPLDGVPGRDAGGEVALATLFRDQGQEALIPRMQTRAELYDLLGYDQWEARDRVYFDGTNRDPVDR